jgi:hypothetical protein
VLAQQNPAKRNFQAEINAAIQSAKMAAGFEHLGTLVRTCLLPQSGGENLTDNVPGYVADPASARRVKPGMPIRPRSLITYTSSGASFIRPGR